ncbi:Rieske 2Fe-2S family protein [Actinophytocola oryzae]|uniref:Rieske 2Fe-2S family protein n=2 Tax=Actinophytocola oryzae TaxID=502181 RepID=A0A4R7W039_9PSEU|nr:Rieske 2Fe-2S family protein [Actinophytocola oryzae]
MLPARAYTAPEVLAWERRHLFAGTWTCAGRLDELLGDHTQRAVTAGDIPVLLTRHGESVTAFANTCRHRGHELLPEDGTSARPVVVCPYHAWVFGLDGELRAAPRFAETPADHGLVPLPVEVWHGWVFVNGTGDAGPFARHVGALADLVAPYAPEGLTLGARHEYEMRANWKVVVENYHECYHCPHIHPELCAVSPPTSGDNYDLPGAWVGGAMDLRDHAETMSLDGRSSGTFLPGVDRRRVLYLALFPDLLLSLHPDYVMTHRLRPRAPDTTWIECSWYALQEDVGYAEEFWDRTNRQDWAACESVQRGLASPHFRPGPFAPAEDAVHQWVTMIGNAYLGTPPG